MSIVNGTNATTDCPPDIWDGLLPIVPHAKPPGAMNQLRLVAYDIAEPKRWRRVFETCEDYGVRVQYSLFECWLDEDRFRQLWEHLVGLLDEDEDRLVAYTLDAANVRRRQTAGKTMLGTEPVTCYIV